MGAAQPLALPCTGGAVPKPDWLGKSIQMRLDWLPLSVIDLVSTVSPLSVAQQIVGTVVAETLCANQAQDPGDLNLGDLLWDLAGAAIPNPLGSPGTLGWWLGQKLQYYAFNTMCQCSAGGGTIPLPIVPTPPAGSQPYPPDPQLQPPLTRIEQNQQISGQALTTIYNGLQLGVTEIRDLGVRLRSSVVLPNGSYTFPMVGEGEYWFDKVDDNNNEWLNDVFGIQVNLTVIPPSVARRGTTFQRLYGVGSVEWNCSENPSNPHVIAQRDALHYERQFVMSPRHSQSWSVRWRLQPGVEATGWRVLRSSGVAVYQPLDPDQNAYQTFDNWSSPPGWTDSPFYPLPSGAISRLSGPKP